MIEDSGLGQKCGMIVSHTQRRIPVKMLRTVSLCFAVLFGCAVYGGEVVVSPTPVTVGNERLVPHAGGWWNPNEGGSGHFFEFMQNADGSLIGFATTYTYDEAGKSTFLIVQGPMTFTTESERQATGVIARLSGPLLKAENGQPFGGAYRPAAVSPSSYGTGEYVWFTRRKAEFRSSGRVTPLRPLSPLSPEAEVERLLTGTWALQGHVRRNPEISQDATYERTVSHVVRIVKSPSQPTWVEPPRAVGLPASARSQFWQPTSNVITFDVLCEADCQPNPHPYGEAYKTFGMTVGSRIWVDVETGRAGYVTLASASLDSAFAYWATEENLGTGSYRDGGTNWTFDLFIDDAKIVGRGGVIVTHPIWPKGFHPGSEIVMTKIDPKTGIRGVKIY